jgi:hypothetical protein
MLFTQREFSRINLKNDCVVVGIACVITEVVLEIRVRRE